MRRLFVICFLFSTSLALAQDDGYVYGETPTKPSNTQKSGFDWSRVTLGGGFGMTFGDYTFVEVAPNMGYYLTDNVLVGIGANYTYYEDKYYNYQTSIYGGRVFAEYLFDGLPLLAHTEAEVINFEEYLGSRINVVNLYVGGGIQQKFSGNSYFYILALWNLNETRESLYFNPPSPIIRGGIAIGL